MNPFEIASPDYGRISNALEDWHPAQSIPLLAALLTLPEYAPHVLRLEMLVHLACVHAHGTRTPSTEEISRIAGEELGSLPLARFEDPIEDVFVSNIVTVGGNYRLIEGTWASSAFHLDAILRSLLSPPHYPWKQPLLKECLALLRLSESMLYRSNLDRWTQGGQSPADSFPPLDPERLALGSRAVTFTNADLQQLKIQTDSLHPFTLSEVEYPNLRTSTALDSQLVRRPLVIAGDSLILALPTAVSPSLRLHILDRYRAEGRLPDLQTALTSLHRHLLIEEGLRRLPDVAPVSLKQRHFLGATVSADTAVVQFDLDKYLCVQLLHDSVDQIAEKGLQSLLEFSGDETQAFDRHIAAIIADLKKDNSRASVVVLVIIGGLGRDVFLSLYALGERCHVTSMGLGEFLSWTQAKSVSALRLWKLLSLINEVERHGVHVAGIQDIINVYAYWEHSNYGMIQWDMQYPTENSFLLIAPGSELPFNIQVHQAHDPHGVSWPNSGKIHGVRRLHPYPYFKGEAGRPIYVSLPAIQGGELKGVVETKRGPCWLELETMNLPRSFDSAAYQVWEAMLNWLDRILPVLETRLAPSMKSPIHLRIELIGHNGLDSVDAVLSVDRPPCPYTVVDLDGVTSTTYLPAEFLKYFNAAENTGERLILENLTQGILSILQRHEGSSWNIDWADLVGATLGGTSARFFHLFRTSNPSEYLLPHGDPHARHVAEDCSHVERLGLAHQALGHNDLESIDGESKCNRFLKSCVEILWRRIRSQLAQYSRAHVVRVAMEQMARLQADRLHWRRTARALLSVYEDPADTLQVALERDSRTNIAKLSNRVLVEMAICTCPSADGLDMPLSEYDVAIARIDLLIECAYLCDAVYSGLLAPHISIKRNGDFSLSGEFFTSVCHPYATRMFSEEFRDSAEGYSKLFADDDAEPRTPHSLGSRFSDAYLAEYGLSVDRTFEAVGEILEVGIERRTTDGQAVVSATCKSDVVSRLSTRRSFSTQEAERFLDQYVLFPRASWETTPAGYLDRDWQPWKFRRRLSMMFRPLVAVDEGDDYRILFQGYHLVQAVSHFIGALRESWLPPAYFTSREMQTYCGDQARLLGHELAQAAQTILQGQGWVTRLEVPMTELGAPAEFGDIDVLSWREDDTRLLVVECKRLRTAKTVGEICERLTDFRGEEGDSAARHQRRLQWITANLDAVRRLLGIGQESLRPTPLIVTNEIVPMQHAIGSSLDPKAVIDLRNLAAWVRSSRRD